MQSLNYNIYLNQMKTMLQTFRTDQEHSYMRSSDGKKSFIDGLSIHFGLQTNVAYYVFSITFYRLHKLITQGWIQDSLQEWAPINLSLLRICILAFTTGFHFQKSVTKDSDNSLKLHVYIFAVKDSFVSLVREGEGHTAEPFCKKPIQGNVQV